MHGIFVFLAPLTVHVRATKPSIYFFFCLQFINEKILLLIEMPQNLSVPLFLLATSVSLRLCLACLLVSVEC